MVLIMMQGACDFYNRDELQIVSRLRIKRNK